MTTMAEALMKCPAREHVRRVCIIEEAISWLNTPFVSEARIKGVGSDCAEFLIGVYANAGMIEPFKTEHHPRQWHLHSTDELYLREIVKYAREVETPIPGDMAVFHVKKAYAHAGIVIDWPSKIIHCIDRGGVQWGDAGRDAFLIMEQREFPPKFFSVFTHSN